MKHHMLLTAAALLAHPAFAAPAAVKAPIPAAWPSRIPAGCPVPQSGEFAALGFTGRFATYSNADTWYPSWGADDRLYSPFTDGSVITPGPDGKPEPLKSWSGGAEAVVGHAVITGTDPLHLEIKEPGLIPGNPAPYGGRYPCACLHKDGVWYIGTYALANMPYGLNWPVCGPFAGFHISKDGGKTWTPSPLSCEPGRGLFPEPAQFKGPVKFGVPHVVDFGKNMEGSPDGLMYMVPENIPSKFIAKDGRSFWLCYSTNWGNLGAGRKYQAVPVGGTYSMTLQEVRLLSADEAAKAPTMPGIPSGK